MPPDDIGDDSPAQQTVSRARHVLSGDKPMVAVDQGDGVVTLHKMRVVPSALWRSPLWRRCALPDWACNVTAPGEQFLALVVHLASRQQDAIDALRATLDDLRAVRRRIAEIGAKEVVGPVDEIGKRIRDIVEDLDR